MTTTAFTAYTAPSDDVVTECKSRMRAGGFEIPVEPPVQPMIENDFHAMPELPEDPSLLSDEEVMCLFFAFTEWASYAETAVWVAQTDEGQIEGKASRARNAAVLKASGARTVTEQKHAAAADPNVMRLEDSLYTQTCLRKGLETVLRRCERNASALSRELSRRGAKASTTARANKWGA